MTPDPQNLIKVFSGPLELAETFLADLKHAGIAGKVVGTELAASFGSALPGSTELWVHQIDVAKAKSIIDGHAKHALGAPLNSSSASRCAVPQ